MSSVLLIITVLIYSHQVNNLRKEVKELKTRVEDFVLSSEFDDWGANECDERI